MSLIQIKNKTLKIDPSVYISDSAQVIGEVEIGPKSSVWFGSVVRGDVDRIQIGARSNVQDLSMIHVRHDGFPTIIGDDVTLGHRVTLHGCVIKDRVIVGIGAIVLDGAIVESDSMIAAGSVVPPGMLVPSGMLVMGSPAKIKRPLREEELKWIKSSADYYVTYQEMYRG